MRRIALALLLLAPVAVRADEDGPRTAILPSSVIMQVRNYLGSQPHDQVAGLINAITLCVQPQIPQNGATTDRGQCPDVTKAIKAQEEATAKAVASAKEAQKAEDAKAAEAPKP